MKRSKMIREIYKTLMTWQDCKLTTKTAESVLEKIESLGMLPPGTDEMQVTKLDGTPLGILHGQYEWDEEGRKKTRG